MPEIDLSLLARDGDVAASRVATGVLPPRMRWKTRILLPGIIVLATTALVGLAASDALWPATLVRVVPVLVMTDLEAQPAGQVVVQAPGWVEADPFPVGVSALADGVVEEMLVLEGERVERGQVVARLIADDARVAMSHAEAALAERRAELASARARLEEARRNWDHPIELTRKLCTAEARLAEARAALDRWPAELAREQAHATYLKADYERVASLHERGQASDIELIQSRQAYEARRAQVEATRRRQPMLQARIHNLEAEVQAASDDLRLRIADAAALAEAQAAVARTESAVAVAEARHDEADLRLSRMEVRSPADGVVMTRLAEPGTKVMRQMDDPYSAQIVRLYDPRNLQVRVDVPLVEAARVGVGQPAEVIVDVLPNRVFAGELIRIVHEADVQKNTLQVKVAIRDPSPELKPEMLARARFLGQPKAGDTAGRESTEQLLIPEAALSRQDGGSFVWLADQVDNVARRRTVTTGGAAREGWVIVNEGLRPGDRVIVEPPAGLSNGHRIRLLEE